MNNFLRVRDLKVHFPTDDGVVKAVHAKAGDSLAVDAVIMEFA